MHGYHGNNHCSNKVQRTTTGRGENVGTISIDLDKVGSTWDGWTNDSASEASNCTTVTMIPVSDVALGPITNHFHRMPCVLGCGLRLHRTNVGVLGVVRGLAQLMLPRLWALPQTYVQPQQTSVETDA
jgi:hypothetical protein